MAGSLKPISDAEILSLISDFRAMLPEGASISAVVAVLAVTGIEGNVEGMAEVSFASLGLTDEGCHDMLVLAMDNFHNEEKIHSTMRRH